MATGQGARESDRTMTMMEHLAELRQRLIYCCLALAGGLLVATAVPIPSRLALPWYRASITGWLIEFICSPADCSRLQVIHPGEFPITYLKMGLVAGATLAMPVIVYQIMMFVLPALLPHEKKYLYMALPGTMVSFALGVAFAYFALLPVAVQFLISFGSDVVQTQWTLDSYLGFVTTLLFWMGVSFETPLFIFLLAKMRVVQYRSLARFRRYAVLLAFVAAAVITPTPDPINQTLVGLPLYLLYEIGAQMSRFA